MLFLRHVREVEVLRDGQTARCYRREDADDICEIAGGDQPCLWLMLRGDFVADAATLCGRFPGKIEDRRRTEVTVAIPLEADVDGLLCAYLPPTNQRPARTPKRRFLSRIRSQAPDHRQLPR